jgi:hypothetical protein
MVLLYIQIREAVCQTAYGHVTYIFFIQTASSLGIKTAHSRLPMEAHFLSVCPGVCVSVIELLQDEWMPTFCRCVCVSVCVCVCLSLKSSKMSGRIQMKLSGHEETISEVAYF